MREDFLGFFSTADTKTLTQLLLNRLRELDLDPAHMVGQGYDGAGSVSGKVRGVQAHIRAQYPAAVYVHCRNHALNLAIVLDNNNNNILLSCYLLIVMLLLIL